MEHSGFKRKKLTFAIYEHEKPSLSVEKLEKDFKDRFSYILISFNKEIYILLAQNLS